MPCRTREGSENPAAYYNDCVQCFFLKSVLLTAFQMPHILPNIGMGLGPGIPWSEK